MKKLILFLNAAAAALLLATAPAALAAPAAGKLGNDDCVKCHAAEPAAIAQAGAKHKNVGCQDCHTGHRPSSKNNIPQCSMCHSGRPHFQLKACNSCHRNPHQPKNIVLPPKTTDPCLSCHTDQIKQLQENKSKHTALYCSTCHDVHGKIPKCVQCHKPHSAAMATDSCGKCHKAHKPLVVLYGTDVPNKDCGACHAKAVELLAGSNTKHKPLACVYCHDAKHKNVPQCQKCHGTPHPATLLSKFSKCGDCHSIAHDLNRWAPGQQPAPAKEKAQPAHKKKK